MLSVNKIILVGNLGKDAETRYTTGDTSITSFSVATTHSWKKGEEWINETTWHNVTAFKTSDYVKNALLKGTPVYVEGRLAKKEYTDKEGVKRYSVDVIADKIIPLTKSEGKASSEQTASEPEVTVDNNDDLPF